MLLIIVFTLATNSGVVSQTSKKKKASKLFSFQEIFLSLSKKAVDLLAKKKFFFFLLLHIFCYIYNLYIYFTYILYYTFYYLFNPATQFHILLKKHDNAMRKTTTKITPSS